MSNSQTSTASQHSFPRVETEPETPRESRSASEQSEQRAGAQTGDSTVDLPGCVAAVEASAIGDMQDQLALLGIGTDCVHELRALGLDGGSAIASGYFDNAKALIRCVREFGRPAKGYLSRSIR